MGTGSAGSSEPACRCGSAAFAAYVAALQFTVGRMQSSPFCKGVESVNFFANLSENVAFGVLCCGCLPKAVPRIVIPRIRYLTRMGAIEEPSYAFKHQRCL